MQIIIESQFFAPLQAFVYFAHAETILLEACENYQKRTYRNRCRILTANGPLVISVPLKKGKNRQTPIRQVDIVHEPDWLAAFQTQLQSAYGKAPFFQYYRDGIFEILQRKPEKLFSLNRELLSFVFKQLGWKKLLGETSDYYRNYGPDYCDLRDRWRPVDVDPGHWSGIRYPQVFEHKFGFTGSLSILDLLFNMGPESGLVLQETKIDFKQ
jgi:hypothetical protein